MTEPQITVSILSWLLEDRLIKTLTQIPKTTSLPLNLCLHVQGEEQISRETRKKIHEAASGFVRQEIYFTPHNNGCAVPRAALLKRSSKTPYVFMTDNDMDFQEGSIDILYNFLEEPENSSYGIVNLVDSSLRWHRRVDDAHRRVTYFPVSLDPPRFVDIDLCGACSSLLRSEIAKIPDIIDTNYYLGSWDIDFCMNIRKLGWKLATYCDKEHKSNNDISHRNKEYNKVKGLSPTRVEGIERFGNKWRFGPEVDRFEVLGVKEYNVDTVVISRAIYTSLGNHPDIGVLTKPRIRHMQDFFIDSLKAQIDKNFSVYLFVGSKDNETTKVIESLNWGDLRVKYIYTDDSLSEWRDSMEKSGNWGREVDPGCPEDIVRRIGHPKHTVMARMDNDDWVAPGWIAHMRHMASTSKEKRFLINYQVIGQASDGRLYRFFAPHTQHRTSPFIALVQKTIPQISPYEDVHLNMGKKFPVVYNISPSYVFMVIQGGNRSNRFYPNDKFYGDFEDHKLGEVEPVYRSVEATKSAPIPLKRREVAVKKEVKKLQQPQRSVTGTDWRARIAAASLNN